ncbi:uncharacterized protein LOC134801576 [Cydia splendana]|uniref:uncharacterized protein LOC134801576 n=1 Tax=Cydia splendana TaxID=1100963 RepID=UPI0028F47576
MENLLTLYDTDEDRVKVKEEPVEPAATTDPVSVRPHTDPLNVRPHTDLLNAGPHTALLNVGPHTDPLNVGPHLDPLNVGPHTDPLSVGPHYNPLTAEPYEATVNECAGEGTVDHPYKRPRLMDYRTGVKPNSSTIDGDVPQQFLNVSPNIRRTVQPQDFLMATTSNLRESHADLLVNNDLKRTQTLIQIDPTNVKEFQTKVTVDPSDSEQLQTVLLIDPSDFRVKTVQQVTSDVRESLDVIQVIPSILRVSQGVLQIPSHLKRSGSPKCDFQRSHSSVYENSIRDYIESEVDDSDLDEDYRVEKDLIDEDSIDETDEEDIAGGVGRRTRKATNMIRGPSEVMLRTLTSEAAVQLQPLTSSDIRKWIHRKTRRKD